MLWLLLFIVAAVALAYAGASFATTTAVSGIAILLFGVFGHAALTCVLLAMAWAIVLLPLNADALRQEWFTRPLLTHFRSRNRQAPWSMRPQQPATSAAGWETQLLQPRMDWERLRALPAAALSDEEQTFLTGPVETFCRLCQAWRMSGADGELSNEAWTFLRRYGLLALRIPHELGGLQFSASAVAAIHAKIASSPGGIGVAAIVAQANAPGLVDWLQQDGSDAQKLAWLPRLARGEALACSAPADFWKGIGDGPDDYATGIVVEEPWQGAATLGVRLDFHLKAVPLAAVADLIGVCFQLRDPDHRLGRSAAVGRSCVLLPRDTPGIEVIAVHGLARVMSAGSLHARGLFVPLDWLLGGVQRMGGAQQLSGASLDAGRGLPLMAAMAGNAVFIALAAAAWARMQRPQGHALNESGIARERLARMVANAYGADALRRAAAAALDRGERSAAAGLLVTIQGAALNQMVTADAMALLGADATLQGTSGWLGYRWAEAAVGSAAEGVTLDAGYGRAFLETLRHGHPYLGAEMKAAHDDNPAQALEEFDALIWPHLGRAAAAAARSWLLGITGSLGATVPTGTARRHRQRASRYAAALTLTSEAALLSLGDELGRHEVLLARLGEIFGLLYRLAALLRKWDDDNRPADDWAIIDWGCLDLFHQIEVAFADVQRRLPSRLLRGLIRLLTFPFGHWARPPGETLSIIAAARLCSPGSSRQRLTAICFAPRTAGGPLNTLDAALDAWLPVEPLARRCEEAQRLGQIPQGPLADSLPAAIAAGLLNDDEAGRLQEALALVVAACS